MLKHAVSFAANEPLEERLPAQAACIHQDAGQRSLTEVLILSTNNLEQPVQLVPRSKGKVLDIID